MSVLRSLVLLMALPLLVAADEPGLERPAAAPKVKAGSARPPAVPAKPTPAKRSAAKPKLAPKGVRVFRFDALRVEGLAGPSALVLHDLQLGRRRSLVQRRRSFLHRMLAAVEVGARGRP